jgi:hypothetical protein
VSEAKLPVDGCSRNCKGSSSKCKGSAGFTSKQALNQLQGQLGAMCSALSDQTNTITVAPFVVLGDQPDIC